MSERITYNFSYFYYNRFMINNEIPSNSNGIINLSKNSNKKSGQQKVNLKYKDIEGINPYTTIEDYFKFNPLPLIPIDLPDNNINIKFNTEVLYPGLLIGIGNTNLYIKPEDAIPSKNNKNELIYKKFACLGFTLDYVTGMPYIPGSAVKGLLWSVFREKSTFVEKWLLDEKICTNSDVFKTVDKLKEYLFGYKVSNHDVSNEENTDSDNTHYCRNVYYDAVIVKSKDNQAFLDQDNICPHKLNNEGGIDKNPIMFIRVTPGTEFEFRFKINNKIATEMEKTTGVSLELLEKLFKSIIRNFGIGAKTNLGYGRME